MKVQKYSPPSVPLVLTPPPAIVALLQDQYPSALGQRQLVGLLRLVVVLHHRGAQRLRGLLHAPRARGLGPGAPAHWGAVRWKGLRTGALFHFFLDAAK